MSRISKLCALVALATFPGCAVTDDADVEPDLSEALADVEPLTASVEGTAGASAVIQTLLVSKESELSSQWWRSPEVGCGSYYRALGLGFAQPRTPNILFRGVIPRDGGRAIEAAAHEDLAGMPEPWSMSVYGTCAAAPAGYQIVEAVSTSSSTSPRSVEAVCPAGKKVIGAGGTLSGADGRVKVDDIRPTPQLDRVVVAASEDRNGTTDSWRVRAYAICAVPPPGLVMYSSSQEDGATGTFTASCGPDQRMLGFGGGVAASDARDLRVYLMIPSAFSVTVVVGARPGAGVQGTGRAFAICAGE